MSFVVCVFCLLPVLFLRFARACGNDSLSPLGPVWNWKSYSHAALEQTRSVTMAGNDSSIPWLDIPLE